MVMRDTDYAALAKWAGSGDVATPESEGLDRAVGWPASYEDMTSDDAPEREVINYQMREITAALLDIMDFSVLPYDANQPYKEHSLALGNDGEIYQSQSAGNTGNAITSTTYWQPFQEVTQADIDVVFDGVSRSGTTLTFTRVNNTTRAISLPTTGMTADGVIASASINVGTQTITLTTSLGDDVEVDVSSLLDDFLTQSEVDARARVRYTDGEKSDVQGLVFATQGQAEDGTVTNRYMNPLRTSQAIAAQGGGNVPDIATQAEALAGTSNAEIMTPLRSRQAIDDRVPDILPDIASQNEAEAGTNNTDIMTSLRTAQAIDAQGVNVPDVATQAEALAGTNNADIMTPLRSRQAINDRVPDILPDIASQNEAETGTNNSDQMTPLRTAQAIDVLADGLTQGQVDARASARYTNAEKTDVQALQFASQPQAEAGTDQSRYMNPLRTAQAISAQSGASLRGWGETPSGSADTDDLWLYLQPDFANASLGTRIALDMYSNISMRALAVDSSYIYVIDNTNDQIPRFTLQGTFVDFVVSALGTGIWRGLAVSGGLLYALNDITSAVVQIYNLSGVSQGSISLGTGNWEAVAVSGGLLYALNDITSAVVQIYNLSGVSQGSISLGTGNWLGLAVSGSLLYALEEGANTVQIYNLSGVSQGSISLGTGAWSGLGLSGSTLYALDNAAEEVLPITTTARTIPALGRRQSGAWTRIPIA